MYIIIVGCGDIGYRLSLEFSSGDDNIVVIDKNRRATENLGTRFNGRIIIGDALDVDVLREANMDTADIVFVLTGNENLNLVIGQLAQKMFKVKKVVVQVRSFLKEEVFKKKGLIIINRTNFFLDKFKKCIL